MNFRQVGKKIKSIGNIKKITKAMQMVAAVKMKKAQTVALQGKPYRELLQGMLARVSDKKPNAFIKQEGKEYSPKTLYIVLTSNRGTCGSFNFNIVKAISKNVNFKESTFITLGKKGAVMLSKLGATIKADFSENLPFVNNVSAIFSLISQSFLSGEYGKVAIVYSKFVSTFTIVPSIETLLPISKEDLIKLQVDKDQFNEYLIEPNQNDLLVSLLNDYLKEKITGSILESEASEQSSRMVAMKNATDNANDIIFNLTLIKNKLRQASITNELLDITTAKEATETQ